MKPINQLHHRDTETQSQKDKSREKHFQEMKRFGRLYEHFDVPSSLIGLCSVRDFPLCLCVSVVRL